MEAKRLLMAIVVGVTTIFTIAVLTSLILSLILKFTSLEESSMKWAILIISFLSVFIGGFVAGGKGKAKGWLLGAVTGFLYSFVVFLIQFLGYSQSFSSSQMLFHLGFLGVAVLGGMMGVNLTSSRQSA
ncbi:TIGR04086 family membrane protein [Priestia koreensis]|uniref:TIGR04086 family membrane protein n=1 Tax=Priestia koreensis TaxID=284581 RepID=UPI001F5816E1|nr:TIGR04086 family membrane protein [Priestia koreensis]MCM3002616.1 TIGR04086 family membrane protein [Priestia koreensis]UNL84322.1 TIGR04086 family membrane protein [Priestia koreensis]